MEIASVGRIQNVRVGGMEDAQIGGIADVHMGGIEDVSAPGAMRVEEPPAPPPAAAAPAAAPQPAPPAPPPQPQDTAVITPPGQPATITPTVIPAPSLPDPFPPFNFEELFGGSDPVPNNPAPTPTAPANPTPAPAPAPTNPTSQNFTPTGQYHKQWKSVSDPHVTDVNGRTFDINNTGDYTLAHSDQGPALDLSTTVGPVPGKSGIWNTAATVQVGSDTISFDAASGSLTVNGQARSFSSGGVIDLPGGGQIQMLSEAVGSTACNKLHIFTGVGSSPHNMNNSERISLLCYPNQHYIDVTGHIDKGRTDLAGLVV